MVIVITGMGWLNSQTSINLILEVLNPQTVLNIGTAGGLKQNEIGALISPQLLSSDTQTFHNNTRPYFLIPCDIYRHKTQLNLFTVRDADTPQIKRPI